MEGNRTGDRIFEPIELNHNYRLFALTLLMFRILRTDHKEDVSFFPIESIKTIDKAYQIM